MKHKYYYTYQIKVINPQSSLFGSYYFGKHETDNLDDGYFGSSKILRNYKSKYGICGLEKTILHYYDSRKALCEAEHLLVEEKRKDKNICCLNLREGGTGGRWKDYVSEEVFQERVQKSTEMFLAKTTPEQRSRNARKAGESRRTPERRQAQSERALKMHAERSEEFKAQVYTKAGNSRKAFNKTDYGKQRLEEIRLKNIQTNKETSRQWRSEFKDLFGRTPESFRKFGKLQESIDLFKQIKNLSNEEQRNEVNRFMESVSSGRQ